MKFTEGMIVELFTWGGTIRHESSDLLHRLILISLLLRGSNKEILKLSKRILKLLSSFIKYCANVFSKRDGKM